MKSTAKNNPSQAAEENAGIQRPSRSQSSENIYRPPDTQSVAGNIRNLVEKLWKPAKVGIGRDAKGLYHSSIDITDITLIGNDSVFQLYSKKKKMIEQFAATVGGKLNPPETYATVTSPIQTAGFGSLVKALNCGINEYYLFHGTPIGNLESIERYGFFMEKYKHLMLGKGIYFTEDPVKADQYTGKGDDVKEPLCCMILCRVLLGDGVIQRRNVKNPTMTSDATSAPCKTCLKPKPDCQCRKSTKYDSVIFDGLVFREFVVYETCSCFPEFAILYKRVKSNVCPMIIG
ncbi:uncharacterized protein LOC128558794 [Mercenaria mercenaria]|uniref:uncharacterized protein LOC128558794 n=1 Tax=Mercenaria mercenaria TaxID=6596 RepID=UPI00234E8E9A|nr:uncharacterized protein LOC128558794 [Mercenaria mercenaria]